MWRLLRLLVLLVSIASNLDEVYEVTMFGFCEMSLHVDGTNDLLRRESIKDMYCI